MNLAEIWLRDPRYLNQVLVQARSTSFGLRDIRIATRAGIRILLDQAAGIVIDLLVALSLIALVTAAVMLGAAARAEVQRRLRAIGVRRALGAQRGHIVLAHGLEAALVAAPAATVGLAAGVLATAGASDRLLTLLNEPAPGTALVLPLLAGWLLSVAIPVAATSWPAWRAAGGSPVRLLRGGDVSTAGGRAGRVLAARRWPGRARSAPRRRQARAVGRDHRYARPLDRVRTAAALARLRAAHARDRSRGARQALPADRVAAARARAAGARDPRRRVRRAAIRGPGGRLVLARRDDRRDRLPGRSHEVRGAAAGVRPPAPRRRRGGGRDGAGRRARARARLDAGGRAALGRRAAAARRRGRQLAGP